MTAAGFPHSGITGSKPACGSPMLFAAYHALLRLSVPRHPPCALVRLTGNSFPNSRIRFRTLLKPHTRRTLPLPLQDAPSRTSSHGERIHPGRRKATADPGKATSGALLDPYFTQPSTRIFNGSLTPLLNRRPVTRTGSPRFPRE
jgi:hypothetical protein